jgi:hypothetical protein
VHHDHVRVREASDELGLAPEARHHVRSTHELALQDLDRDITFHAELASAVHPGHGAHTDRLVDPELVVEGQPDIGITPARSHGLHVPGPAGTESRVSQLSPKDGHGLTLEQQASAITRIQ